MNLILLSGGSGKRLWPLSNEVRSKQFLKVFTRDDGTKESMVQRMYRMICDMDNQANVLIATSKNQVTSIRSQLGDRVGISIEPCRRDTFPAIAMATAYLHDVDGKSDEESVVVCPVDPYVDQSFFSLLYKLNEQVLKQEANLVLIGIEPTYPSEKFGYILPVTQDEISYVREFKEKPPAELAKQYINEGALWNGGVFGYRIGYVLEIAREVFGTSNYQELYERYEELEKISFDYAVVEKEPRIQVMRYRGAWKDLGTWNTLTDAMDDELAGNATAPECRNTHIINELQIPLIALGVSDLVITATPDGILVADKDKTDKLKNYVADQRPMFEQREWGEYKVLDYRIQHNGENSLTKHLSIRRGKHISYHRHAFRTEIWTFLEGRGELIIEGKRIPVKRGDTMMVEPGVRHGILACDDLNVIEVQLGEELTEEDVERLDWDWDSQE